MRPYVKHKFYLMSYKMGIFGNYFFCLNLQGLSVAGIYLQTNGTMKR
jgi:hypothetical protein